MSDGLLLKYAWDKRQHAPKWLRQVSKIAPKGLAWPVGDLEGAADIIEKQDARIRELETKLKVKEREINDLRDFLKGQSNNALKFLQKPVLAAQEKTDE